MRNRPIAAAFPLSAVPDLADAYAGRRRLATRNHRHVTPDIADAVRGSTEGTGAHYISGHPNTLGRDHEHCRCAASTFGKCSSRVAEAQSPHQRRATPGSRELIPGITTGPSVSAFHAAWELVWLQLLTMYTIGFDNSRLSLWQIGTVLRAGHDLAHCSSENSNM